MNFENEAKKLYFIAGVTSFLQLITIAGYGVALAVLGPKPQTAQEFFLIQQNSSLEVILRSDFLLMVLIGLYLITFPALYLALRKLSPIFSAMALMMTIAAAVITFSTDSTLSMLYLGERYLSAATDALRAQYLSAGEAVIALDMWNSSGSYANGILLQGSGVIISLIMLRSPDFRKLTAWSGLLGNGFDLIQHVLHPFLPALMAPIQSFMGVFYLVWYVMLGLDLLRLGKSTSKPEALIQLSN